MFAAGKRILATTPKPEVNGSTRCFLQVTQGLPQTPNIRLLQKNVVLDRAFWEACHNAFPGVPNKVPPSQVNIFQVNGYRIPYCIRNSLIREACLNAFPGASHKELACNGIIIGHCFLGGLQECLSGTQNRSQRLVCLLIRR